MLLVLRQFICFQIITSEESADLLVEGGGDRELGDLVFVVEAASHDHGGGPHQGVQGPVGAPRQDVPGVQLDVEHEAPVEGHLINHTTSTTL